MYDLCTLKKSSAGSWLSNDLIVTLDIIGLGELDR
jgi:hypothetical protein